MFADYGLIFVLVLVIAVVVAAMIFIIAAGVRIALRAERRRSTFTPPHA